MNNLNFVIAIATIVFFIALFSIYFLSNPFRRAMFLRTLTRRNYGVAMIRHAGGQIYFHVVNLAGGTFKIRDRAYTVNEQYIYYYGSVPLLFFNFQDTAQLPFTSEELRDKPFRDSEHVSGAFIIMKALLEGLAMRDKAILMYLIAAAIAVAGVSAFLGYVCLDKINVIASDVNLLKNTLNSTTIIRSVI